ncbi:hypothetical protein C8F04DRAFT_1263021 [Mycena alexandri]|uniref:Uncharacterized protein n=1 Tax=Mycena alexandri TaxID=1745969 RepID=A0AAD6SPB3_9AGAR|nr:hypothetical protein C8F04DRAFT_1263021 [Mycena alexandri]
MFLLLWPGAYYHMYCGLAHPSVAPYIANTPSISSAPPSGPRTFVPAFNTYVAPYNARAPHSLERTAYTLPKTYTTRVARAPRLRLREAARTYGVPRRTTAYVHLM